MSWKYKLGILYLSFVVMILFIVGLAYTGKVELVDENYYQKELNFQKTIDAKQRGLIYENSFRVHQNTQEIWWEYPEHLKSIPVKVLGYCYSDASKDFQSELQKPFSKSLLRKGNYQLTIQWGSFPLDTIVEIKTIIE
jgi:hypothetical protein